MFNFIRTIVRDEFEKIKSEYYELVATENEKLQSMIEAKISNYEAKKVCISMFIENSVMEAKASFQHELASVEGELAEAKAHLAFVVRKMEDLAGKIKG